MFKHPVGRKALPQSLLCTLLVCLTVLFLVGCNSNYTLTGTTNGNGHRGSTTSSGSGSTNSGSGSSNSGSGSTNSGSGSSNSGSGSSNSGSGSSNSGSTSAPSLPISIKYFPIQGNLPSAVLVDAQGMTLYVHTTNPSDCTGACTQQWPPLLSNGSCTPSSTTNVPGTLSVINGANGVQVEYQGYPLYASALDTAPGQFQLSTTGAGPGSSGWSVATTDIIYAGPQTLPTPGAWCGQ
jgi:predicted lipoprotein with Yx(FWY)xxD motif